MNLYTAYFVDGTQAPVNGKNESEAVSTAQTMRRKAVARLVFVKKVECVQAAESDFDFLQRTAMRRRW